MIEIVSPLVPEVGVKLLIFGTDDINTKPARESVPAGVVNFTEPEPPPPNTTFTSESDITVNGGAKLPKRTWVVPVNLNPLIEIVSPLVPEDGVKLLILGDTDEVKIKPANESVPVVAVTLTAPDLPFPITADTIESLTTLNEAAATPPKRTAFTAVRVWPLIVMVSPCLPCAGVNE